MPRAEGRRQRPKALARKNICRLLWRGRGHGLHHAPRHCRATGKPDFRKQGEAIRRNNLRGTGRRDGGAITESLSARGQPPAHWTETFTAPPRSRSRTTAHSLTLFIHRPPGPSGKEAEEGPPCIVKHQPYMGCRAHQEAGAGTPCIVKHQPCMGRRAPPEGRSGTPFMYSQAPS